MIDEVEFFARMLVTDVYIGWFLPVIACIVWIAWRMVVSWAYQGPSPGKYGPTVWTKI